MVADDMVPEVYEKMSNYKVLYCFAADSWIMGILITLRALSFCVQWRGGYLMLRPF